MFTLKDTDRPSLAPSAVRGLTRAVLLAGIALPLILFTQSRMARDIPPAIPQPIAAPAADPVADMGKLLTDALAGMRYGLAPADLDLYRRAFSAIDSLDWGIVEATVPHIQDRRLLGHLLAARYLSPSHETPFADLRAWLDLYGDLPEADDIYRLALTEMPRDATLPQPRATAAADSTADSGDIIKSNEPHTAAGDHAFSRFFSSDDKGALAEAVRAIGQLGDRASTSHWIAGLAAWRLGNFEEAGRHFTALAGAPTASGWMQAAGAYWAGRVNEHNGVAAAASKWFANASRYPTTFYGMLAMRKLGLDIAQEVSAASLTAEHLDTLAETPAGYRAIALLEIGRRDLAAQELEKIDPAGNPKLEEAVIVTADAAHLGELSSNLAQRIAQPADDASAHFPIPSWKPRGGFRIDPALVYALARQESRFDPTAVSPAGATGLMQLMPTTASAVAPKLQASLLDPSTNLDIGQRYLRSLMNDPNIGENLLLLAVAYNHGSGNPARFRQMLDHDDPLLAVESIKTDETRGFIQHVLANYWIYRARLGGDTSSLTELADGRWPLYRWDDPLTGATETSSFLRSPPFD
jgi:soluble lytic murein transglycosylase-like protein